MIPKTTYLPENREHLRAELLAEVANIIAAYLDRDTVLRRCLEALKGVVDYDTATIAVFSDGIEWELAVGVGFKDEAHTNLVSATVLKESPILMQMARDKQPVVSPDVHHLPGWMWIPGAEHVRSFAAVPMVAYEQMTGVLMIDKSLVDFYDEQDLAILQTLSQTLAVAIEKTKLYEAMQQRIAEQDALLAVSQAVSSSLEIEVVLGQLVEQMAKAIHMTSAYISEWHPERGTATVIAEYIGPEASDKERISDLGETYNMVEDFGENQDWLYTGEIRTEHVDDPDLRPQYAQHYKNYGARSVMVLPLMVKGKAVGFADLWESRQRREFTPAEIALAQAIAQQAAIAIENARLFAEKKEQLRLSKTLQDVGALLTNQLTLQEVFNQIFELLGEIIGYDSASVHLIDESGGVYVAAGKGLADSFIYKSFAAGHSQEIIDRFSEGNIVQVIPDTQADPNWILIEGLEVVRSWIGAALIVKGRLIGILNVDNSRPYAYSPTMGPTVLAFANQAAVAIENARLYEETSRRANEMRVLHQVAMATSGISDVDSLLEQTTTMVAENLYREHFGFLLFDVEVDALMPHPSFYGAPEESFDVPVPMDNSFCAEVYKSGLPAVAGDVTAEKNYFCILPTTLSEIAVPLVVRENVIGVINAESSRHNAFSANDLRFLTTLAGQLATFIERADLYTEQRKYTAHLASEVSQRTAALRAERDRMQAILDNAGEGVFFTDQDGVVLYVNSAMARMTGYSALDLLHRAPENWLGIDHQSDLFADMVTAVQSGQSWKGELIGLKKDKRSFDIYLTISPIYGSNAALNGFVAVHSDISYLKEVERLKSRFIANMSHELRTPLTAIEMYTTLLKKGKPERHGHYLEVLGRETKRLTRLIQDVLDLSRMESDSTPVEMNEVQLEKIIKQVVNTFLPHAESKDISLQFEQVTPLTAVWGNSGQLEQAVTNLVNNGLLYTPDSGIVLVRAGQEKQDGQETVWFSVMDTGPGIPQEDLPHIFDRFFRSKVVEHEAIRGTGLGLAICKEIIERHNGAITAKTMPGGGATITVRLPAHL